MSTSDEDVSEGDCLSKVCGSTVVCCIKPYDGAFTEVFDPKEKAERILSAVVNKKRKMNASSADQVAGSSTSTHVQVAGESTPTHSIQVQEASNSTSTQQSLSPVGEIPQSPKSFAVIHDNEEHKGIQCQIPGETLPFAADNDKCCRLCMKGEMPKYGMWVGCDYEDNCIPGSFWVHEKYLGFSGLTKSILKKLGWLCPQHRKY